MMVKSWQFVAGLWLLMTVVSYAVGLHSLTVAIVVFGIALLVAERIEILRTGRTISENTGIQINRRPWLVWVVLALLVGASVALVVHFWAY